jgi:hypothetical protein
MDARLAKLGMQRDARRTLRAECSGCGRTTDLVISMGGHATCTECGAVHRITLAD